MVGNHVADLVGRYGEHSDMVPEALTAYIKDRAGLRLRHHGRAGNPDTAFVPDEIVDRFCLIGPPEAHLEKLRGAARPGRRPVRGLRHARRAGGDVDAYGEHVIPQFEAGT